MLLLEQETIKKGQVDKTMSKLEFQDDGDKKYKIEAICNSAVYTKKL